MSQKKGLIYEFSEFRLDPDEKLLIKEGEPVSLTPKAFEVLVLLIERRGHLVEKSELIERVWENAFVEDAAVSRCIWAIRTALGDDSKDQKLIQTVPKRGYRFVAHVSQKSTHEKRTLVEISRPGTPTPSGAYDSPVTRSAAFFASAVAVASEPVKDTVLPFPANSDSTDSETRTRFTPSVVPPLSRQFSPYSIAAVIGIIAILLGGFFGNRYFGSGGKQINSIAVMPFVNESGDPQVEYLSDGLTDTLISSLSELPNIKVKARTAVFGYKGKEIDSKAIGRELGVQAIVNGRVTRQDGRTSVKLEVVDTETTDIIFSTNYDTPQSGLVTLQSDIARDVSGKLKRKLSGAEEARVTKTNTADPEALQLYLQGQFYRYKGGRGNVLQATDYFNKAIEKDPNYALAYASLALNYRSYDLYNLVPDWQKASAAAKRSLELDDSLAEAHLATGDFRRAIELNPDYADAHVGLCIRLTMTKRFDEGISECKRAHELDPLSVIVAMRLGAAYFFARRPDESIEALTRAHEMDPTLWVPLGYLGGAQTLTGQYLEAAATFRKAIEISDGSPNTKSHLAYALAKAGQRDEALKLIDDLKRQAEREHISSFHFAVPYIGLGDKDDAFFWLGKGIDDGSIGYSNLDVHPWFDELRSDPRFTALLERAKSPESSIKPQP